MPLQDINLCHIDPSNKSEGKYTVTVHTNSGGAHAVFDCDSEHDALKLREAIRQHAAQLKRVNDYSA